MRIEQRDVRPRGVEGLIRAAVGGQLGAPPSEYVATSAFWVRNTTRLAGSETTYLNHYVLVRSGTSFGAASFEPGEAEADYCAEVSGHTLAEVLEGQLPLAVRVAALDAYLAELQPHASAPSAEVVMLPAGRPEVRARARDEAIAALLDIRARQEVALIGVVNPLVLAIEARGGRCLPCDYNLQATAWNQPVSNRMEEVLERAEAVVATGMTLANGTFDRIIERCRVRQIPLVVYAQTGSAVARAFLGIGVSAVCAEPFPFSQFSAEPTRLFRYRAVGGQARP